jgi:hypothetical protein
MENKEKDILKKETLVGIAPLNLVKLGIIEARDNFILAYEDYTEGIEKSGDPTPAYLISRLRVWFLKMQAYLKRTEEEHDYLYTKEMIMDNKELELLEILELYYILNQEMDAMGLTKIDTKDRIDRTRIELVNRSHGL